MKRVENDQTDRKESTEQVERVRAEANMRTIERSQMPRPERTPDYSFIDKASRPITLRSWESGNTLYTRAYDITHGPVPENINRGQAGLINASVEHAYDGGRPRVRIGDVYTYPDYRGAGVAGGMINQTEQYAHRHGAREIYGVIAEPQARQFWEQQADHGWQLVQNGSYLEVHKQL